MYVITDSDGRVVESDHPINILSGRAVGPLGAIGQALVVAADGQNLAWSTPIAGSGVNHQVAYWSTASALAGDASLTFDTQKLALTPVAAAAGSSALVVTAAAHTAETAELLDIQFNLTRTVTFTHSSFTLATQRAVIFQAPTYASGSVGTDTITSAATVAIGGAPATSGSAMVITNPYALWVQSGTTRLEGQLRAGITDYVYLGEYNSGTPTYPVTGRTGLAIAWNFTGGSRDVSFWNIDNTPATSSFVFRQLTGASARTDLLTLTPTGNMLLTGKLTSYDGIAVVGEGVPPIVATIDLTTKGAAVAAGTLIYAVVTAGLYRLNWYAKVTQAATSSSTLGALSVAYTDGTDSSILGVTALGQTLAGAAATTNALNTLGTLLTGTLDIWAKAGSNLNYGFAYASSGATPMQYELHMKLEYLG